MDNFLTMSEMALKIENSRQALAYCDYIATIIQNNLKYEDQKDRSMLTSVSKIQYDLNEYGSLASTKKTMVVEDINGKQYKITVEEL